LLDLASLCHHHHPSRVIIGEVEKQCTTSTVSTLVVVVASTSYTIPKLPMMRLNRKSSKSKNKDKVRTIRLVAVVGHWGELSCVEFPARGAVTVIWNGFIRFVCTEYAASTTRPAYVLPMRGHALR
jgi:hypothetical protein